MSNYTDDFTDYKGTKLKVDWTDRLWSDHLNKHSEIKDHVHTSLIIREAVLEPSLVIEGEKPGNGENIVCYYKEHKRNKSDVYYTKVVIGCKSRPFYVKTVFMQWALCSVAVQEKKYGFKELYRDPKTYL